MTRPDWDSWALGIAAAVAQRADCRRRLVGAVILDSERRLIGAGYPGVAPGGVGCLAGGCPRGLLSNSELAPSSSYDTGIGTCNSTHAEANALLDSDPVRRRGATLYCTAEPCGGCWKLIQASGVVRAVWPEGEWTSA